MNKLQKASIVALISTLILAGLSPAWGQRWRPKKFKKARIENKLKRKITLRDLRSRGKHFNPNFNKLGPNHPITYALQTGLSVAQVKKNARFAAATSLQDAQEALTEPYADVAVTAAKQAWNDAKLAGLRGEELTPYRAVLQQANDRLWGKRSLSQQAKLDAAKFFFDDAKKDFFAGNTVDALYQAGLGVKFAEEAGLTGEALAPYQKMLEEAKQTLTDETQASEMAFDFDPLHSGVPFTRLQELLYRAKIYELEGTEIDALENLVNKIEPAQKFLMETAKEKLEHVKKLAEAAYYEGALVEAESALEDLRNADFPEEGLKKHEQLIRILKAILNM